MLGLADNVLSDADGSGNPYDIDLNFSIRSIRISAKTRTNNLRLYFYFFHDVFHFLDGRPVFIRDLFKLNAHN